MPLTDIKVKSLKPYPTKDYKEPDEKGLYLLVKRDGSKYWRFKYRFLKKEKLLALGVYPEISLANARTQRDEAWELIRKGIDPIVNKKALAIAHQESSENCFEVIANEWLMIRGKKSDGDRRHKSLLKRDLFPYIGHRPIKEITRHIEFHIFRLIKRKLIQT